MMRSSTVRVCRFDRLCRLMLLLLLLLSLLCSGLAV
jgi:hypothetical protein